MKITFLGAAKTVTGSCYLVETDTCRFLVDCGMFQGHSKEEAMNEEPFPFNPRELDFMLLTHAHIDHSGRIPVLFNEGFKGRIYSTKATAELSAIMLPDSGHIQEFENEWINRKRERAGQPPVKPLYTCQNAVDCIKLFESVKYGDVIKPCDGIKLRFNDAGHILGSSIIELWAQEKGEEIKVVFSGDLGNSGMPILRDPSFIDSADYVFIESTYGDRIHTDTGNKVDRFIDIIDETLKKGGNVVIPSFAVGRTQEIIYELHNGREKYGDKLKTLLKTPVYIDSPLAVSATEVFRNNPDCFDEEARAYVQNGDNPLDFPGLKFTRSTEESKALNNRKDSIIIISSSGMCEAGRIKHHLKHNLWRKESSIIFVGYQAEGTLGRQLAEGAKTVQLFGEEIAVHARIEMIEGFSGHADRDGLLNWLNRFDRKPRKVFIVHGEENVMNDFASRINRQLGIETVIPSKGAGYIVNKDNVFEAELTREEKPALAKGDQETLGLLEELRDKTDRAYSTLWNRLSIERNGNEIQKIKAGLLKIKSNLEELLKA